MANVNANIERTTHGLSDWNHRLIHGTNGAVPNGDTLTLDLSSFLAPSVEGPSVQPMIPYAVSVTSVGAVGAVGARTHTQAPATVTWTYNESTQSLVVTNGSGGPLTLHVQVILGPVTT